MRALPWCGFALLAACSYQPTPAEPSGVDAPTGGMECGWSFPPSHIGDPCDLTVNPPLVLTTGTWSYDTTTGVLRDAGGIETTPPSALLEGDPAIRVLTTESLQIPQGATLNVAGGAAFALVVDDAATIDGAIDVSGTLIGNEIKPGPGGNAASCATRNGGVGESRTMTMFGGGGGGGGGFGTNGAIGGNGDNDNSTLVTVAMGGAAGIASASDFVIRGGCGGGDGGVSNNVKGVPGAGGGVLLLIAKGAAAIRTSAQLRSAGSGALNGLSNSGGPGGGSGGMLAVEAGTLVVSGTLCANGGGGAGGSSDNSLGGRGESGACAEVAAGGGSAAANDNGDGGAGGFGTTAPQPGESNVGDNDGGGGGGGSVGRIYLRAGSLTNTGVITPPPIDLPL